MLIYCRYGGRNSLYEIELTGRFMFNQSNHSYIRGLGIALPVTRLSSSDIDKRMNVKSGTLERSCGVKYRYIAKGESQEALAAEAAAKALIESGLKVDDIDLLLFGAAVGRQPIPATAPLVKKLLKAEHCAFASYDINATCLSFLVAMDQAALHISVGRAKNVLVVTSEIASRALPWKTASHIAGLFSDGAAACVLSSSDDVLISNRISSFHMETFSEGYDYCSLQSGGTRYDVHENPEEFIQHAYFEMNGKALYKLSCERMPGFIDRLLKKANWNRSDIDLVVPHQASPHALAHLSKRCGFGADRVFNIVSDIGNQVAASIPIALFKARAEGRLHDGMKVLLLGTSAGVSLGGASLTI